MKASRTIAKNTALLTVGVLVGRALGVLVIKRMTSVLENSSLGIWGTATDLVAILLVMSNFGLGTLLTREITRRRSMTLPLLWSVLKLRWLVGAAGYLLLLMFARMSGFSELKTAAFLVTGLAIFIESTAMACDAVLQGHEKVQHQTVGQLVSAVVYFVLAMSALDRGYGLMGIIWANAISRLVRLLVMVPLMLKATGPWQWHDPEAGKPPTMAAMMRLGWPLFLATTFGILYNKIDTVMLNTMLGDAVSSVYVIGHRALDIMIIVPGLFGTAVFPALARYGEKADGNARRLGERALRYLMVAIVPLTLLLMFLAEPIIGFFNETGAYADAVPVLKIVIWGLPLQAVCIIFSRLLITANRERVFVRIGLGSMLVNIILNTILIPRYSYYGASAATIVSMVVSFALHYRYVRRTALNPAIGLALGGPVLATALAWVLTVLLLGRVVPSWHTDWFYLPIREGWGAFWATTSLMTFLYAICLAWGRVFGAEDWRLLKDIRR